MRKKIIAGNWKMNKTANEAHALVESLLAVEVNPSKKQVIIIPPQLYISEFSKYNKAGFAIGAQNCHAQAEGAFTGEISAPMLKSVNIQYCLVGHSERRKYFNETDADCLAKVRSLFANGITPILCVGEELSVREGGYHFQHVIHQLSVVYAGIPEHEAARLIIAYEPVWAIGTGKTATTEQASEMHTFIRSLTNKTFNRSVADQVHILYGGSVNENNSQELMEASDIDGVLVGGASLKAESFMKIITSV